ncbi:MAG TPA: DNA internalization-related competence protein ComEC/Rec2 [Rhizobacter sp.]
MGGKQWAGHALGMGLAWLAGIALQLHERTLMPLVAYQALLGAALLAVAVAWRWPTLRWLWILAALAAGLGTSGWRAGLRLADALPATLEGQDVQLVGVVASLPQVSATGLRFRFDVESATQQGQAVRVPARVSLGWYVGWHEDGGLSEPQLALRAGQRWRFTVRLRQPHGNVNPQGFDYELYLFEQGLRATGYVRASELAQPSMLDAAAGRWVDRLRQRVRDAIGVHVADARAAGVLAALAVGDQSAIEREDWQLFRNTGVAHLMSISGLHVTMFAWLAGLLITALWRRSSRAVHLWPAPWAGRVGGLLAATAYAVFAGWGVPAQRTVWMLATVTLLQLGGRRWPWAMVLLAAAVVVSAVDPWALLQPGFWLSFVAVGLLMASEPARREADPPPAPAWWRRAWRAARGGVRTQLVATFGLTPLSLVFFHQVSLVGLAANLLAIPLVTLVITPLALLGVLLAPLWRLGAAVQETLSHALAWLGSMPGAVWLVPAAPAWAQAAGLAGAVLALLPLPWRLRALAVPLAVPLLLPAPERPDAGHYEVMAVDVGQGTAVLVRTQRHLLVYDAGPQYSRESDAGQRVLLPLLQARGETRIDRLVLSHRDLDHVGGAKAVLQTLPVDELLSSLEDGHALRALPRRDTRCVAGQRWSWDGVQFEVLHPRPEDYARGLKPNAVSCVIKVSGPQGSLLLTGDIERQQEAELLATSYEALRSDVMLVPHHGSRTSSTAAFLDAVAPKVAIVQAGYRNRFGHPVAEVLDRLRARGVRIETSAACGAWRWTGAAATCERERVHRYWHHAAGHE